MKRRTIRITLCMCLYLSTGGGVPLPVAAQEGTTIIPRPVRMEERAEIFIFNRFTVIDADPFFADQAYFMQRELLRHTGLALPVRQPREGETHVRFVRTDVPGSAEAYRIRMEQRSIELHAATPEAVFRAVTTLMQLVRHAAWDGRSSVTANGAATGVHTAVGQPFTVTCWDIDDWPTYGWRGVMLDEARHFFGIEKVKQYLDWMAFYKLNRFHWHLTDAQGWRIEIKQYPNLALVGGIGTLTDPNHMTQYYTQEEIAEVVRYAAERFITIVPEIDMPGHASAANRAYPEFSGGGSAAWPEFTFNPGKEGTYAYLTTILREVDALFPSQMIHIGGDEVHYGNEKWSTDPDMVATMQREKLPDTKALENYFFRRMADSLISIGNMVVAWDEVVDSDLPRDKTIVFYWRYRRPEQLQKAMESKYPVVLCPNRPMYLDYVQDTLMMYGPDWRRFSANSAERIYHFKKADISVTYPADAPILGIQANLWTERIRTPQRLDFMLFPRIAALSETAWCEEAVRNDWEGFSKRMEAHFKLYDKNGVYYYNIFDPKKTGEPKP